MKTSRPLRRSVEVRKTVCSTLPMQNSRSDPGGTTEDVGFAGTEREEGGKLSVGIFEGVRCSVTARGPWPRGVRFVGDVVVVVLTGPLDLQDRGMHLDFESE